MKKKWKVAAITTLTVGMLGSAALAAPQNWTEVKALFNHKMQVTVNGQAPGQEFTPLMVDGVAYLPVRELAETLDHEVVWIEEDYRIDIQKNGEEIEEETAPVDEEPAGEEDAAFESSQAVILAIRDGQNGGKTIDIAPTEGSSFAIITLHVSAEILEELEEEPAVGMMVNATYSKAMTRSIPPQTNAKSLELLYELGEEEAVVQSVSPTDNGIRIYVTNTPEEHGSGIVLGIDEDTSILSPNGEKLELSDIKEGSKIKAYYGPQVALSLPPQSSAHLVFVLE